MLTALTARYVFQKQACHLESPKCFPPNASAGELPSGSGTAHTMPLAYCFSLLLQREAGSPSP